jgi:hypothetical protein
MSFLLEMGALKADFGGMQNFSVIGISFAYIQRELCWWLEPFQRQEYS